MKGVDQISKHFRNFNPTGYGSSGRASQMAGNILSKLENPLVMHCDGYVTLISHGSPAILVMTYSQTLYNPAPRPRLASPNYTVCCKQLWILQQTALTMESPPPPTKN